MEGDRADLSFLISELHHSSYAGFISIYKFFAKRVDGLHVGVNALLLFDVGITSLM